MNDVEAIHSYKENQVNQSRYMNNTDRVNFTTSELNTTTTTENIRTAIDENITDTITSTAVFPNLTVIGTMMKTALTLSDVEINVFNHSFYIYIWVAALVGCTVLTTFRYLYITFSTVNHDSYY